MPELPEVETVRRGLDKLTKNQVIEGSEVLLARTIAYPLSVGEFDNHILGTAIASWQRRGKYLIAELIDKSQKPAGYLGVHLRMTGQLLWVKQSEPLQKHTRVCLFFLIIKSYVLLILELLASFGWFLRARRSRQLLLDYRN